ncbi:class I SAM-dependent RNA methyltransferase [Sulfitobacter albidus]|uniref:Class I SAM-dependent RNA methyltransferase n=1 Tax=Sulfitobacter albidus TaxID=2829501 RepID=A0A975PMA0_9RHOB|nr:RsmD family RNA methyltransferase [Sulfitobacter albidus]QUJ76206.1 class I SAM-dependent RNA methyltransferase [Sulfitobacter albidus]
MTEYTIQRLGQHGDGIAPGPLFAPMTLPGEVISATPQGDQLSDIRILTPSADRVSPPCRHFKSCGGCQLQHAADPLVAAWKTDGIIRALGAQGIEAEVRPIVTSPRNSRRRATLAARRTKKGAMVGFHGRASGTIIEIPDCQLLDSALMPAIPLAEALAISGASRKAPLALTVTVGESGLDVSVTGGKTLDGPLRQTLAAICEAHGCDRLTWEDETVAQRTPPVVRFDGIGVTPPPGGFLQATVHGEESLRRAVTEAVGEAARIVDLFAGCGTFALPLARGAEVTAVEGSADMIAALDHGWRQAKGLKTLRAVARDLFRRPLLPDEFKKIDAVVIDPPRAGAEAQTAEIARAQVPRIAFVSCNPVTFARDANILISAGYRLDWVQPVDQFRWSAHTELAAQFTLT